jgi:hypothetical protein
VQDRQLLRLGAVCGFAYVALVVASQVYLSSLPIPSTKGKTTEQADKIFLSFVHQHSGAFAGTALLAALSFALLIVVDIALLPVLSRPNFRLPRIAILVGLVSLVVSIVSVILGYIDLSNYANRLASAHTSAQTHAVLVQYHSGSTRDIIVEQIGILGTAVWLGLVGASLIRLRGRSSLAGWGSLAAGVLAGLGFPILIAWAAGAGVGLWRLSQAAVEYDNAETEAGQSRRDILEEASVSAPTPRQTRVPETVDAEVASVPARAPRGTAEPRYQPAKGSKSARHRKRR